MTSLPYVTFAPFAHADRVEDDELARKIEAQSEWPVASLTDRSALEAILTETNALLASLSSDSINDALDTDTPCWLAVDAYGVTNSTYDLIDLLDFHDAFGASYGTFIRTDHPIDDLFEILRHHPQLVGQITAGKARIYPDASITKLSSGTIVISNN